VLTPFDQREFKLPGVSPCAQHSHRSVARGSGVLSREPSPVSLGGSVCPYVRCNTVGLAKRFRLFGLSRHCCGAGSGKEMEGAEGVALYFSTHFCASIES